MRAVGELLLKFIISYSFISEVNFSLNHFIKTASLLGSSAMNGSLIGHLIELSWMSII